MTIWVKWDKRTDGVFIVFCFLFVAGKIAYSYEILGGLQRSALRISEVSLQLWADGAAML